MIHSPAGEEISISYIDLAAPRPQRRRDLLQQYFFDIDPRAGPAPEPASVHELIAGLHGTAGEVQVHVLNPKIGLTLISRGSDGHMRAPLVQREWWQLNIAMGVTFDAAVQVHRHEPPSPLDPGREALTALTGGY